METSCLPSALNGRVSAPDRHALTLDPRARRLHPRTNQADAALTARASLRSHRALQGCCERGKLCWPAVRRPAVSKRRDRLGTFRGVEFVYFEFFRKIIGLSLRAHLRVVARVRVLDVVRSLAVNLDHRLSLGECKLLRPCRHVEEAALLHR